jgi:hypothetical protein
MGGMRLTVAPGLFVLLDYTRFYQMEMDTEHEAIDLMMPQGWLEKYLPDPEALLARPIDARPSTGSGGWGARSARCWRRCSPASTMRRCRGR